MTQYIGQITVILETGTPELASETLGFLARQLDDTCPEVVFADHNGDIEDYDEIEREREESLATPARAEPGQRLPEIARAHLGISTLETRHSDRLDFHDVAVWQVEAALKAAFHAGAAGTATPSGPTTDAPAMLEALLLARRALNTAPRFRVGDTDSYHIAAQVDRAIEATSARSEP